MNEHIDKKMITVTGTDHPVTTKRLVSDLENLGLKKGDVILVHTSLSKIGWTAGGVQAVVEALIQSVGPDGTIVTPAHSTHLTDPVHWQNPPIPQSWHDEVRTSSPAFDKDRTPTRGLGQLPEVLRRWPGAIRSDHPHNSFAALGAGAIEITKVHALNSPMGAKSPLQSLYDLDAKILFIGTNWDTCTAFHLAEDRIPELPMAAQGAPVKIKGKTQWITFDCTDYDSDDFAECGDTFEEISDLQSGNIGQAESKLFSLRNAVDFAENWIRAKRLS